MIGRLRGQVIRKDTQGVLLDVSGVGYEIEVPLGTLCDLPEAEQDAVLHTHLVVREDAHLLFGFLHERDRDVFRELIKVSGVGAKTALAMLSSYDASALMSIVAQQDINALSQVPGIGKKSAERIMVSLKGRLDTWQDADSQPVVLRQTGAEQSAEGQALADAIAGLVALGYKPQDANRIAKRVAADGQSSDVIIRAALKEASS